MQAEDFPGMAWLSALWREVEVTAPDGPDGLAVRFQLKQPLCAVPGLHHHRPAARAPVGAGARRRHDELAVQHAAGRHWPVPAWPISATEAKLKPNPTYHGAAALSSMGSPFASIPTIRA